jgi:D-glycero-D-manno-heptose 1,7-bisphosphate phosphatase
MRPAVFLDRDGTLIHEVGYIDRLDLLSLFPWTVDALRLLNRAGFATVVVTNQGAIGRGLITEEFLARVHAEIDGRLAAGRARIDRYYFCPHHPEAVIAEHRRRCRCRKPGPELVERACAELALDPAASWMIGDRWIDVATGQAAGVRSILVKTGHGAHEAADPPEGACADAILNNLMEAVGWILRSRTSR